MRSLEYAWTDAELDESVLKLCDEFPATRMVECSRALEYCRRVTPRGSPESLHTAMREALRHGIALPPIAYASAA